MATKLSYTFEKKIDINMSTTSSSQSASSLADPSLVFAGLVIQFAITITVCLVSLIIFESLRHRLGWIYAPKFNKDTAVQKSTSLSPKKLVY
jgi:hypothetical protein